MRLIRLLLITYISTIKLNLHSTNTFMLVSANILSVILRLVALSVLSLISFFHCLFCVESTLIKGGVLVRCSSLAYTVFNDSSIFFLFVKSDKQSVRSCEAIFSSLRWQEREISEFFNVTFTGKIDKRSLFLTPMFGLFPLQKDFPTCGFFEIGLHAVFGLTYSRVFVK